MAHPPSTLRVAVAQVSGQVEPLAARLQRLEALMSTARADLVLFPEAVVPGYGPTAASPETARRGLDWVRTAARNHRCHIAAGLVEPNASTLVVASPTGQTWRYAKRFVTWAEAAVWSPGQEAGIADTPLGRLGLVLCADLVQEDTWRDLTGSADLVLVAAAWPDYRGRRRRLPRGVRSVFAPVLLGAGPRRDAILSEVPTALGVPLAYANASGRWQAGEGFSGESRILDCTGTVVAQVDEDEGLATATVSLNPQRPGRVPTTPLSWRAFNRAHRLAAWARRAPRRGR